MGYQGYRHCWGYQAEDSVGVTRDTDIVGVIRDEDSVGVTRDTDIVGVIRDEDGVGVTRDTDIVGVIRDNDSGWVIKWKVHHPLITSTLGQVWY